MRSSSQCVPRFADHGKRFFVFLLLLIVHGSLAPSLLLAQAPGQGTRQGSGQEVSQQELEELASNNQQARAKIQEGGEPSPGINFFELLVRGGVFMIPIAGVSIIVVMFAFERAFHIRRSRILPRGLVKGLGQIARESESLEPRAAYKLCLQFPSAASNVIRSMLLKVGRPHSEVESAIAEASQREADRLYANVRWLNLAGGIAPLLGLLGTVWGLIQAFHDTTQLGPSQNRAEYLARGIYEALVTTLAGLLVAIPAVMLSHYFEGKIANFFRQLEELMFHLSAQVERFEGRVRFSPSGKDLVTRSGTESNKPRDTEAVSDDIVASLASARPAKSASVPPPPRGTSH